MKGIFTVNGDGLENRRHYGDDFVVGPRRIDREGINIEKQIERFGEWLKGKVKSAGDSGFVEDL